MKCEHCILCEGLKLWLVLLQIYQALSVISRSPWEITGGFYNQQVYRGFMRVCHYVMAIQRVVVSSCPNAALEINRSSLLFIA